MTTRYFTPTILVLLLALATAAPALGQVAEAHEHPPRLVDPDSVARVIQRSIPDAYREAGLGGVARIRVFVTGPGRPDSVVIASSTGFPRFDGAARQALDQAAFEPALGPDGPVPAWTTIPIQFGTRDPGLDRELTVEGREQALESATIYYPSDLEALGARLVVHVGFVVDGTGRVVDHAVIDPTCFPAADERALLATQALRFEARTGDPEDRFFTVATLTFSGDSATIRIRGDEVPPPPPAEPRPRGEAPAERPRLRNTDVVRRALQRHYPAELREQGVGGTAVLWAFVQTNGRVGNMEIHESSGWCDLDLAALRTARAMRFHPATYDGERVPVWVRLPITFETVR